MLNSIITMDLHIHSYASKYKELKDKEGHTIVDNSTYDNVEVLLDRLLENKVCLFSITDHNRYDSKLYDTIIEKIEDAKYNFLHILSGVEFDVLLEENAQPVHIVTIFDARTKDDRLIIEKEINENILNDPKEYYIKDKFEDLLKRIGLSTILIVHQKMSLDRRGKSRSLSEGVSNPYTIIEAGYIDALEYQKPHVEGILLNNLNKIDSDISLVTGSDCHDWSVYPNHDSSQINEKMYFSKIKALPTFKGLLLAITSPKTRFNRHFKQDTNYLDSFYIGDKKILLDYGINVIIGENGSGKSTLLNILGNNKIEKYMLKLQTENGIKCDKQQLKVQFVAQSEIVNKYNNSKLLYGEDKYFKEVDNSLFINEYDTFSRQLKESINRNIDIANSINVLSQKNFLIDLEKERQDTYYVTISPNGLEVNENKHSSHRKKLASILRDVIREYQTGYYDENDKILLLSAIKNLYKVYISIREKEEETELQNKVKNSILSKINDYNARINSISSSMDVEKAEYLKNKSNFVEAIINACKHKVLNNVRVEPPKIIENDGKSIARNNGFTFTKVAHYYHADLLDEFLTTMFVKDYYNLDSLYSINSKQEFIKAVAGITKLDQLDEGWDYNYEKFKKRAIECKSFISEQAKSDTIGNTLGEMSLVYYKFQTAENDQWDVLMIDQPEDNISNNRIYENLVKYFNALRDRKQLIIVTHNPILVVNQDADNVLFLNKVNNQITITGGCLDDEENDILGKVAQVLDGGEKLIKQRMKVYGKNN